MIRGQVEDGIPTITLTLEGRAWPAIIDTGFNGDLELPEQMRPLVNPQYIGRFRSFLAGGQYAEEDTYCVMFPFEGQRVQAVATFVPNQQILIGTNFLRRYRLEINFVDQTVVLEREV